MRKQVTLALSLLLAAPLAAQQPADETAVRTVVAAFGKALVSGDSTAVLALLHPDVVIFEGGGWESFDDYRRRHLSADIRATQSLKQETLRDVITVSGDLALSTREYSTTGQRGERVINNVGAETMVLLRTPTGWKIRHIHWSSRARRPAG
ncbi:MAG: nuclear transport factor 2 family protein [Gemmatimonadota bacterium]